MWALTLMWVNVSFDAVSFDAVSFKVNVSFDATVNVYMNVNVNITVNVHMNVNVLIEWCKNNSINTETERFIQFMLCLFLIPFVNSALMFAQYLVESLQTLFLTITNLLSIA